MTRLSTIDRAGGKWRAILVRLGVNASFLTGKHRPCPMCGGRDRFRFDDKAGSGSYICNQCGAGYGIDLLCRTQGWDFKTAASEIDQIIGEVAAIEVRPERTDAKKLHDALGLWERGTPLTIGDPAHRYLSGRNCLPLKLSKCLRFCDETPVPYSRFFAPAMLAAVQDVDGKIVNVHRTFLNSKHGAVDRAMMPGSLPDGAAIRLFPDEVETLGIGEGKETCLAASARFNVPVWSAINSTMLTKWMPPPWVKKVIIFGDADRKFGGQAAAYSLAHKLAARMRLAVDVEIPDQLGTDWDDAL